MPRHDGTINNPMSCLRIIFFLPISHLLFECYIRRYACNNPSNTLPNKSLGCVRWDCCAINLISARKKLTRGFLVPRRVEHSLINWALQSTVASLSREKESIAINGRLTVPIKSEWIAASIIKSLAKQMGLRFGHKMAWGKKSQFSLRGKVCEDINKSKQRKLISSRRRRQKTCNQPWHFSDGFKLPTRFRLLVFFSPFDCKANKKLNWTQIKLRLGCAYDGEKWEFE